jgi:hypothetical protein
LTQTRDRQLVAGALPHAPVGPERRSHLRDGGDAKRRLGCPPPFRSQ